MDIAGLAIKEVNPNRKPLYPLISVSDPVPDWIRVLDLDPGTKKNIENVKSPKKLQSMATFRHNCFEINIF